MPSKSSHERNVAEWQFVFASLWALCGQSRTKLTIPQTLLVRNGCAYKWLATDSKGYLNRKQVSPLLVTNARCRRKQPLSSRSSPSLVVRKQLLSIVDSFGCFGEDGNDKSCIVCWYRDGRHEYVTRQELFKMVLSDRWRLQLVGIQQGVVSHHRRLTGVSGAIDRDDTNKTLGDTSSAAANILASSIAAYIEKSYMDGYDNTVIGGSRSNGRLVVVSLVADFIVDDTLLWFSHAETLVVRYSTDAAPSRCSVVRRGTTELEVEGEAQNAGEKLRGAIRLALQRKTSIQHCFGHFDVDGVGYVGAGGLQDGLSKLGLEISDGASGMLMCWIARADGMHFCSNDLVDFALRSELRLGDNNNENRGDAPGGCVDDDKSGGTTRSRGNGDAANRDLEDQSDSAMSALSPTLSTFTVTRNNENGACVPFEVDLDNHHHIPNLPNDTSINSRPTEEWNVDTNENSNEITVRDEKSGVESDPSGITPTLPPGAPSSSSSLSLPPTLAETPTLTPLSSPTCILSRTNNDRGENTAPLRRAETHLMRQEDKLSLDAFRIDPNNSAAFQKAADEGRERARALRTLAKEEVILEKTVDSGRQRAIKREQRRVAVTNAEESVTRLDLNALKQTVERLKESLRLDQVHVLPQQRLKEEINLEGHLSAKEYHPNAKDQEDQATNATSMLLVNEILIDISTSGQALRDVCCKQHQTRRLVEEYTNEIQSSERTVERLQEGLTKVSTVTPGTGTVSIAASLPFATQEQRIRLKRAKDKLERAVEQLDRAKKQLQWYDESVQASTIVFRQKQGMGKELLAWVESAIERSRGDVVQLRQQREDLGNEASLLKEKSRACQRRIGAIEGEMERFNDNISGTGRSSTCSQQQQQQQGNNRQDVGRVQGRYYFDTSLWHDGGLMQRMEGKDFVRLVEKERSTLRKDLAVHNFRSEEICQEMDHIKELLSANTILLALLDSTRSRLYGSPFLAATAAATAENRSDESKGEEICSVSPQGPPSFGCVTASTCSCDCDGCEVDLASGIRGGKGHNGHDDILTAEEKEWLCLDYTINPYLYERRNNTSRPAGVPIVGSEIIRKLLNLPEQIQLALPYLRSKEEVRAHFLINKYTLGRGEKYFLAIDSAKSRGEYRPTTQSRPSTVDGIINKHRDPSANDAVEVELTSKLGALVKDDEDIASASASASASATSSSYGEYHAIAKDILPASVTTGNDGDCDKIDTGTLSPCVYGSFEELIQAHAIDESVTQPPNVCFLLSSTNAVETLYDIPTQHITRGETQVHRFVINPSRLHVLHSIIITVVFQGTFTSTGYCPGRISASLARQHWCDYGTMSSAVDGAGSSSSCHQFVPIGYSLYEEQGINTKSSIGRIVIRHSDGSEAASSPVMPAHYEILVAAESDARYSISIGGTICPNAQLHLQKEMASFLRDRAAVQRCEADLSSLLNDTRLAERQLALLDKLRREVNAELERCRNDIEQCDLLLEKYDGKSEMTGDDDSGGNCCCGGDCDASESDSSKVIDGLHSDIKVLEIEYAQLSFRMAGRNRQRANMRSRLESMARLRHEVQGKNKALKKAMASRRKIIPLATSALFGTKLGADVANLCDSHFDLEHITSVSVSDTREGPSIVAPNASSSHTPSSSGVTNGTSTAEKIAQLCSTPAEMVRRLARRDAATPGPSTLTVEERKFCLLDRVLYPSKWAWLDDSDNSALAMAALTAGSAEGAAHFVIPTATEILRIKSTPFDQLRRKADKDMKHLLLKYHDGSPSSSSSSATGARRNRGALAATKSKSPHLSTDGDVDDRCYLIQTELDRAMFCRDSFLVSSILNGTPQRFPTQILRLELERELDRLLIDQILSREQEDQKMQAGDGGDARSKCGGTTSNVGTRQGEAQRGGVVKASSQGGKDKRDQEKILFQRRSDRNTDVVDERELDGIENTVRFGLLLLVFSYFRSQHLARQQRKRLPGSHDYMYLEAATPKLKREHERDDA